MYCEYSYCIYYKERACILDEIRVDSIGLCGSCETITIPEEILEGYREKRLKEIEEAGRKYV